MLLLEYDTTPFVPKDKKNTSKLNFHFLIIARNKI